MDSRTMTMLWFGLSVLLVAIGKNDEALIVSILFAGLCIDRLREK